MEAEAVLGALGLEVEQGLGRGGGQVEALDVDVDGGRLGQHLEYPEVAGAGGPAVAEDRLGVAVEDGGVGGLGQSRELVDGLVERRLDRAAMPCVIGT